MSISIRKNAREQFRIERSRYQGHELLNVRVWYDAGDGDFRPGKQGVAIKTELLPEVLDAIDTVMAEQTEAA